MVQNTPLASVIIVNRNGIEFVDACLRSVLGNDYPDFEVIFVDNASADGSPEYAKRNFGNDPRVRFVENKASVGPAVGRNCGIAVAKGRYIAFLDNDTEVDKSWLREMVSVLESDSGIGAAQSKLLRLEPGNRFDCAGDYLTPFGFLSERARGAEDNGQFDYIADIFSAKSAASIIRKDVLDKTGGFDGDFYMYLEETDLSWRVWLAGYRVVFVPHSRVYHAYGTRKKVRERHYSEYVVRFYGCRNYITTLIKNLGFHNLARILPLHLFSWLGLSFMFLCQGKLRYSFWIIKAVVWNLVHAVSLFKKRKMIQRHVRRATDRQILAKVMISNPLDYYFGKAFSYIHGKPF